MVKDAKIHLAHLQGTVNNKMVYYLTDILNAHTIDDESEVLKIIFESAGGITTSADKIISLLNSHGKELILVGSGFIASAGFDILIKTGRRKGLLPNTNAMYHLTTIEVKINSLGNFATDADKFNSVYIKTLHQDTIATCEKAKLTESEIERILDGKDVYFTFERLSQILNEMPIYSPK
jgi:ATP-dependent protease ClpP protease subunit